MHHKQSQAPSRAELEQRLKHQQRQIKKLRAAQSQLRARVAELEKQLAEEGVEEKQQEKEQATREALRHLDDVDYLARSDLAQLVAGVCEQSPTGKDLKQALIQAIRSLRPEQPSYQVPADHYHDVLRLTYLEEKKGEEVANITEISRRQYYRDLKAAIRRVADLILTSQNEN